MPWYLTNAVMLCVGLTHVFAGIALRPLSKMLVTCANANVHGMGFSVNR